MAISNRTLETLIDLVEIKLSCMEVHDREDSREIANLERCRGELKKMITDAATNRVTAALTPSSAHRSHAAI